MKRVLQFIVACVPMLFCMMLIFYFSSQEADVSSATSGKFIAQILSVLPIGFDKMNTYEKLQMIEQAQNFVRKGAHFSIYGLLGVLAMLPMYIAFPKWSKAAFGAWCVALIYSITDEYHQTFVPGRSGEFRDVLIDSAGAALGILVIYGMIRLWERRARKYDM